MNIDYRDTAHKLHVTYLFHKWGVNFLPRNPDNSIRCLFSITPLDGWTFDPKEIENAIRLDDELGIEEQPSTPSHKEQS